MRNPPNYSEGIRGRHPGKGTVFSSRLKRFLPPLRNTSQPADTSSAQSRLDRLYRLTAKEIDGLRLKRNLQFLLLMTCMVGAAVSVYYDYYKTLLLLSMIILHVGYKMIDTVCRIPTLQFELRLQEVKIRTEIR